MWSPVHPHVHHSGADPGVQEQLSKSFLGSSLGLSNSLGSSFSGLWPAIRYSRYPAQRLACRGCTVAAGQRGYVPRGLERQRAARARAPEENHSSSCQGAVPAPRVSCPCRSGHCSVLLLQPHCPDFRIFWKNKWFSHFLSTRSLPCPCSRSSMDPSFMPLCGFLTTFSLH